MRRDKYFAPVVVLVVVASLGGLYALLRSADVPKAPVPPAPSTTPAPSEVLQVSRAPEADERVYGSGALVAFKVRNVSNRTVSSAVITIVLLDPDDDEIRRVSLGVGRTAGERAERLGCTAPLRPGEYCIYLEWVQEPDYRRMARCTTAMVRLGGQ